MAVSTPAHSNAAVLIGLDDAEVYDGAPAGVQLFGRRLQEEKMLVLAEYVGAAVKA